jgi:hypothetical protein
MVDWKPESCLAASNFQFHYTSSSKLEVRRTFRCQVPVVGEGVMVGVSVGDPVGVAVGVGVNVGVAVPVRVAVGVCVMVGVTGV